MKLSKNLDLTEVTRSESAKRNGIDNTPTPEHLENLKKVALNIFQPIREHFKTAINISSGYRSEKLNRLVPGTSITSQHCTGEALDIDMDGTKISNKQIFDFIKGNLVFDQLIWELGDNNNPAWVHVSYESTGKQRKQVLKAIKKNNTTVYIPYS